MEIKITQLVVADLENFPDSVLKVNWLVGLPLEATYEDGTPLYVQKGGESLITNPTDSESFVDFENLTEEKVISWIENHEEFKQAQTEVLREKANKDCPANLIKPLPWA